MPQQVPYTTEDHIRLRRVSSIAPSPDGSWLAVGVQRLDREGTKYVSDIWRVPTDGGPAVQLTRGESKDVAPAFRHDGALAFLSNRQPNEVKPDEDAEKRMQVWILPPEGGEPRQLTDEPLGVEGFKFADKAERLVLFAPVLAGVEHAKQRETAAERAKKGTSVRNYRRQPVRHWDHWLHQNPDRANTHLVLYRADGTERVDLTPEVTTQLSIEPHLDISADGKRALVVWRTTGKDRVQDQSVVVFDLEARTHKVLPQGDNTDSESARFSPDGKTIACIRAVRSAKDVVRPTLTLLDLDGKARPLALDWDRWPNLYDWTPDGRKLLVTADDDGLLSVFSVDAQGGKVERLTARSAGGAHADISALPQGGFACSRSSLLDAPECYVHDGGAEGTPRALARLSNFTPATEWAEVESITTKSTDGTPIQSWITRPKNAGKSPVLLWIHGGPIGMSGDGWHWRWNSLLAVAQGYTVVQPNPRGSTGFGQAFIQGIWGNVWGDQCYKDLMAVADALEKRPDIDASRTMAMGGSFGGYMTNWIGTQTDRFRCLITHASIVTMANFTGTTDHPAWWYLEMGGENPYQDPAGYDRFAPIRHISKWKTPTMVIHGELDYRCPIGEGLNLFEALQYHGVDSELVVFPDENHWILKPRNIVAWYDNVLGFVGKHMQAR
ncbi:MAG TPA: S9 family peptidase [Reyranellaceae bacterium]|nr:S9 family peptidase [Reyranellaceae bacterium]